MPRASDRKSLIPGNRVSRCADDEGYRSGPVLDKRRFGGVGDQKATNAAGPLVTAFCPDLLTRGNLAGRQPIGEIGLRRPADRSMSPIASISTQISEDSNFYTTNEGLVQPGKPLDFWLCSFPKPSNTRSAPGAWVPIRTRWSIPNWECASSSPRSCRHRSEAT